jgi:hypothetical protein
MTNTIAVDNSEVIVTAIEEVVNINICEDIVDISIGETGPQGPRGSQVLSGNINPSPTVGLVGDQYINTSTGRIFGPKTDAGWGGGVQLGQGLEVSDVAYIHYQTTASNVWNVQYALQFKPNITVVDLNGKVIEGDYEYITNAIIATFSQSITGAAYLS